LRFKFVFCLQEIQQFLDESKDGVIFFSFGSNAKTTVLPSEKIKILLKVFSKLKQRVIMKWETDSMEGKPDNVLIGKWLPQDDILAHKNVKLFISHCGLGSTVEAKYHAVPIVGIPLFADQSANTDVVVDEGWGVKVDFATLTEASFSEGIKEVLENQK
jgi:glucuronosyltransferase